MVDLEICLLGQFVAKIAGQPVTKFRSLKSRLLLAYLASNPDVAHARSKLATLFWGDNSDATAKTNLRVELSRLKKVLQAHPALEITRHSVQFHAARATVDVIGFQKSGGMVSAETLTQALDLYIGEFLPAMHPDDAPAFEDWQLMMRENLHQLAMNGYDRLRTLHTMAEAWQPLVTAAQKQLTLTPWHEPAFASLIEAAAGQGDRQTAQAMYKRCKKVLWDELGVIPSQGTEAVWQRVKEADAPKHNLPSALPPFFGRENELAHLEQMLTKRAYRLLTLTGIGGTGKTRLALEVGRRHLDAFPDGVWFVPLAGVDSAEAIYSAIVAALQITDADTPAKLHEQLHQKTMLLILDNLEQLPDDAADLIHDLLQSTEQLIILATSRRRLSLRVEAVVPIQGLTEQPALTLFQAQAQRIDPFAAQPDPTLAAEICQMVSGLPLGIELAVAQLELRDLAAVAVALRASLKTLESTMRDVPKRQRTLRAVFESSWVLLSSAQRRVLTQLATFRGGAMWEDVKAVVQGVQQSILSQLINHSLLRQDETGRYQMHPLVGEFSAEKRPPSDQSRDRHSLHYLSITTDQNNYPRYQLDVDNVRAAWRWAHAQSDLIRLRNSAEAYTNYMLARGNISESIGVLADAAALAKASADNETQASLLINQADLVRRVQHFEPCIALLEEALALNPSKPLQGLLHGILGSNLLEVGQTEAGLRHLESQMSLARAFNDPKMLVGAIDEYAYARVLHFIGNFEDDIALLEEALALVDAHRFEDKRFYILGALSMALLRYGNFPKALHYLMLSLDANRRLANRSGECQDLLQLGLILDHMGQSEQAIIHYIESREIAIDTNDLEQVGLLNANLCMAYRRAGNLEAAIEHGTIGIKQLQSVGALRMEGQARNRMGHALLESGRFEAAFAEYTHAVEHWSDIDNPNRFEAKAGLAASAAKLGKLDRAAEEVESVLEFAFAGNLHKVVEPCLLLLNCATVYVALHKPTRPILHLAQAWVDKIASRVSNPVMREIYRLNIKQHQLLDAAIKGRWESHILV